MINWAETLQFHLYDLSVRAGILQSTLILQTTFDSLKFQTKANHVVLLMCITIKHWQGEYARQPALHFVFAQNYFHASGDERKMYFYLDSRYRKAQWKSGKAQNVISLMSGASPLHATQPPAIIKPSFESFTVSYFPVHKPFYLTQERSEMVATTGIIRGNLYLRYILLLQKTN